MMDANIPIASSESPPQQLHSRPFMRDKRTRHKSILFPVLFIYIILTVLMPPAFLEIFTRYKESGGIILEKIHPASYIILLCIFSKGSNGRSVRSLGFVNWIAPIGFIICIMAALFTGHAYFGAVIVDIMLVPNLFFLMQKQLSPEQSRVLARVFVFLCVLNLVSVTYEWITKQKIYSDYGIEHRWKDNRVQEQFRASGLFQHPLIAGTLCFNAMLVVRHGAFSKSMEMPLLLALIIEIGMLGVRMPLAIGLIIIVAYMIANINTARGFISSSLALIAAPLAIFWLTNHGIFDRIVEQGIWDKSAQARLNIYDSVSALSTTEWLVGVTPDRAERLLTLADVTSNESIFVLCLFSLGAIFTIIYLFSLFIWFQQFVRYDFVFMLATFVGVFGATGFASKGPVVAAYVFSGAFVWQQMRLRRSLREQLVPPRREPLLRGHDPRLKE